MLEHASKMEFEQAAELRDIPSLGSVFANLPLIILGLLMICASGIWSLVEWILIACGKGFDKNGRQVLIWTH